MSNKPIVHAPIATGSTEPRDIRDRFADMPNVKDFGAIGDGTTDDTAAFTAAQNSGAPAIMVPRGTYNITQDVSGTFFSFGYVDVVGGGSVEIIDVLALDSVPIGTVLWLSTSSVPAGYLLCNGSAVGRATYPELFTAIGTTYGAGDGSTTFNLPNLIDRFAEGSTVAGTVKNAGLPNISGTIGTGNRIYRPFTDALDGAFSSWASGVHFYAQSQGSDTSGASQINFDASRSNSIYGNSNTVQPPALTLLPCIKAFVSVVGDATVVAGQLVNEIQSKVALDGSNASAIGSTLAEYMANASMPGHTAISITLPEPDGITGAMPYNGYLYYHTRNTNNNTIINPGLENITTAMRVTGFASTYYVGVDIILPVSKGDIVQVYRAGFQETLTLITCNKN